MALWLSPLCPLISDDRLSCSVRPLIVVAAPPCHGTVAWYSRSTAVVIACGFPLVEDCHPLGQARDAVTLPFPHHATCERHDCACTSVAHLLG
jgi:hypothetical protein